MLEKVFSALNGFLEFTGYFFALLLAIGLWIFFIIAISYCLWQLICYVRFLGRRKL